MNIGVNFFGPKRKLYRDFEGTLEALKKSGFTSAEVCVAFAGNMEPPKELNLQIPPEVIREMAGGIWSLDVAADRIRTVRSHGLAVVSAHVMLGTISSPDQLRDLLPALLEFGQQNQISCFVLSLMKGLEDLKTYAPVLREMSEALSRVGISLAYHNHEMECFPENDTTALDYILEQCPALKLELDVGWAQFAGASSLELMRKHRERLVLLHFKDIRADASPATRETCFTAVGEGSIPLKEIMAEAKRCSIVEHGLVIDQDDSLTDILTDLAIGAEHIRQAASSS